MKTALSNEETLALNHIRFAKLEIDVRIRNLLEVVPEAPPNDLDRADEWSRKVRTLLDVRSRLEEILIANLEYPVGSPRR